MKKTKFGILSVALLSLLTSCGFEEGGSWGTGGIAFAPLLYTSNKDGDCTSIIQGWIESAKAHGVNIEGYDHSDVNTADNSSTWTISYEADSKYNGKVGLLPNQITDMQGLLNEAKSIVSLHQPEYVVVPCFTSEIYKGADMATISPNTKIGAYNAWYGDTTIDSLVNEEGTCENVIGQNTSFALPMIHLLYNQLEGANIYGNTKLSAGNVRNYFYQPWASNDKETYNAMKDISLNYEIPSFTKAQLDRELNGKTPAEIQAFLDKADFNYVKENRGTATTTTTAAKYKIGVIEMSSSANITKPTKEFYETYVEKTYGVEFSFYTNNGSNVLDLVNKANQENCNAVILNCTDTDTITAAATACENEMYTAICNMQVYNFQEEILLNADKSGKVSKYFVGAYGISLDTWKNTSKAMVDIMFDNIKLDEAK